MSRENQRFETFGEWVAFEEAWIASPSCANPRAHLRVICFDTLGRHCWDSRDFMRAANEETFPVRWITPDQAIAAVMQLTGLEKQPLNEGTPDA